MTSELSEEHTERLEHEYLSYARVWKEWLAVFRTQFAQIGIGNNLSLQNQVEIVKILAKAVPSLFPTDGEGTNNIKSAMCEILEILTEMETEYTKLDSAKKSSKATKAGQVIPKSVFSGPLIAYPPRQWFLSKSADELELMKRLESDWSTLSHSALNYFAEPGNPKNIPEKFRLHKDLDAWRDWFNNYEEPAENLKQQENYALSIRLDEIQWKINTFEGLIGSNERLNTSKVSPAEGMTKAVYAEPPAAIARRETSHPPTPSERKLQPNAGEDAARKLAQTKAETARILAEINRSSLEAGKRAIDVAREASETRDRLSERSSAELYRIMQQRTDKMWRDIEELARRRRYR
jgi:hypothetical protein